MGKPLSSPFKMKTTSQTTSSNDREAQSQKPFSGSRHFSFYSDGVERPTDRALLDFRMPEASPRFRWARLTTLMLLAALMLPMTALSQSLWQAGISKSMFADKRASGIGDIITVLIEENTTANTDNETKTEKQSSLSAAITSFLYPQSAGGFLQYKGQMPAMAYNSDHKHDGTGTISDSEQVVAKIAVRIVDVLPNGNFVVEGRRETAFSGERQTILLHGIVRADDVQSDNTVYSYNVADASIQIIGHGTVTESQRKGWFDRIWDIVSPF
jgi:flagellar L-ring protein FlgH